MNERWHGTLGGYTNHKCRCDRCRQVNTDYIYDIRTKRMVDGLPPEDSRHGTDNGYTNYGCRCSECTAAHTAYSRNRGGRP